MVTINNNSTILSSIKWRRLEVAMHLDSSISEAGNAGISLCLSPSFGVALLPPYPRRWRVRLRTASGWARNFDVQNVEERPPSPKTLRHRAD